MKDTKLTRSAKSGRFVLTAALGAKFSAVEGMKTTPRVHDTVKRMAGASLSSAERRTYVKDALRKK